MDRLCETALAGALSIDIRVIEEVAAQLRAAERNSSASFSVMSIRRMQPTATAGTERPLFPRGMSLIKGSSYKDFDSEYCSPCIIPLWVRAGKGKAGCQHA